MIDSSSNLLLDSLHTIDRPTLWLADENALSALQYADIQAHKYLHIATNRYDIYQLAIDKGISVEFNDFTLNELPFAPQRIIYRISKEKALTHYLFNQAARLLATKGELLISGKKQEGIKTYATKLKEHFACEGQLKKSSSDYYGRFTHFTHQVNINDQHYAELQPPFPHHERLSHIVSKPGVFGWDKIDAGTELLLKALPDILQAHEHSCHNILDLGCGYGWIFMNLPHYLPQSTLKDISITATDNNAAAILCAEQNAKANHVNTHIIADDCAKGITDTFDLIVCNPPFHQGFTHEKALTQKFLTQTKRHLSKHGLAVFVVNEFIRLPKEQLDGFNHNRIVIQKDGFKVIALG